MAPADSDITGHSLFIVDRDWLRQGPKARKSWTGNVRNRSLYGLAIRPSEGENTGKNQQILQKPIMKPRSRSRQGGTHDESYFDRRHTADQPVVYNVRNSSLPDIQSDAFRSSVSQDDRSLYPDLIHQRYDRRLVLQANIAFQDPLFERIKSLGYYHDYYLYLIQISQHPIGTRIRTPSASELATWVPLTFEDDMWLQDLTTFPASQTLPNSNTQAASHVDLLMSQFLSQLNHRIGASELSDETIDWVSCLALAEHLKGNEALSRVHAMGLSEMVRLRGGMDKIDRSHCAKLIRSDIIHSIDRLEQPVLSRLSPRSTLPQVSLSMPEAGSSTTEALAKISRRLTCSDLITSISTLRVICGQLDGAWDGHAVLDTTVYYEDTLNVGHDTISLGSLTGFDEIVRLTLLSFMLPMFRYSAFERRANQLRSTRLEEQIRKIDFETSDAEVSLWIVFIGFIFSRDTTADQFFQQQLVRLLALLQIPRKAAWTTLEASLHQVLWTNSVHSAVGKFFYEGLEVSMNRLTYKSP